MTKSDKRNDKNMGEPITDFQTAVDAFCHLYAVAWDDAEITKTANLTCVSSAAHLRPAPGNQPKILHHNKKTQDVIVLIHGITDSPHYVEAIGHEFYRDGFNVVLPLLPAHGLKNPWQAMRRLEHTDWVNHVDQMVTLARGLGERVSLGGFSTGGALTVRKVAKEPESVDGGVFLFSAAVDLGDMQEFLLEGVGGPALGRILDVGNFLRSRIKDKIRQIRQATSVQKDPDDTSFGIGENPYKYSVFFYEGATELAEVVQEIDDYYDALGIPRYSNIKQPVFLAHSKTDGAAKFEGARRLFDNLPGRNRHFYEIEDMAHASVVLKEAIIGDEDSAEYSPANPNFDEMTAEMMEFTKTYIT
jgi:pimeloyl-ACP methyl ester carboxylesterase